MKPPDVIIFERTSIIAAKLKNAIDLADWAFDNEDYYLFKRAMALILTLTKRI